MDRAWWDKYIAQARAEFAGKFYGFMPGIYEVLPSGSGHYQNSGAGAIAMAAHMGAERIILLGYDCRHTGGKAHWHGNHPQGLGNAGKVNEWPLQFGKLAKHLEKYTGLQVVNATRDTALECFTKQSLEEALCESSLLPAGQVLQGSSHRAA